MSGIILDLGGCQQTMAWQLQDLCLEKHSFVNDLGSQLEVSAHSSFSKGQKSVCDMERMVCSHLLRLLLCCRQPGFVEKSLLFNHAVALKTDIAVASKAY